MDHCIDDIRYCESLFSAFYGTGSTERGGVTRLGYTETEDRMHALFANLAKDLGCTIEKDGVGNTFAVHIQSDAYVLIGSHLDSVVEGGRYDGVSGIIAGLMALRWLKQDGIALPIRVAAFRCEESSNFGQCTIGSGLVTGALDPQHVGTLTGKSGGGLQSIFAERGYTLSPARITGMKQYLEVHIEQGKVLEETGTEVGVVSTIAGTRRFRLILKGLAEHSGATPMSMRNDAMCAAAEIILAVERIGQEEAVHHSVATVGIVNNHPNVLNVVPGETELGIDLRGINLESLDRLALRVREEAANICKKRGIDVMEVRLGGSQPVGMSSAVQEGLEKAARRLHISCRNMPSGAGHDAMEFAPLCDTGMVFIPCLKGISHNRKEYAAIRSICDGARVLYEYLKEVTL